MRGPGSEQDEHVGGVPAGASGPSPGPAPAGAPQVDVRHLPGDLIEDREVDKAEQDRLGHVQIAEQLATIAATCRMPANIALYGAWGSGKTGIGNLVRSSVDARRRRTGEKIAFARFDAFKYAEHPLRRNFISAVATELGFPNEDEFHDDLYRGKTTTTIKVPWKSAARVALLFIVIALVISLLLLIMIAGVAGLKGGDFSDNVRDLSGRAVFAALTPAALLSALAVMAVRAFGVETKTDKADSDEQFERVFRKLVAKSGRDRVVVFVDELDRCEPADVVATLDAVRTFLGVERCVFIVAADRQVIEEALADDVKQSTPSDPANPYYSTGSAYLDKVFQYQVEVPPLLQASVTRYAVDLARAVRGEGVWTELRDRLELAVSVLVPSHVRSPRRVKHLLNAYALAYRLAEARHAAGVLATPVRDRADELARLVCLRVEFPLFARNLVRDARLPEYVFRLSGEDSAGDLLWAEYPHVTDEVKALAGRYARKAELVATLLSDDQPENQDRAAASPEATADVRVEQGRQLLTYLSRTHDVRGPGRDLIYLQSTGSEFGLDPELAERLETFVANATTDELVTAVRALPQDKRDGVLMLLAEQARGALGVEARNVASSLLAVSALEGMDLTAHADAALNALAPAIRDAPDRVLAGGLLGAWRLALASDRPTALRLRGLVLVNERTRDDPGIGLLVLRSPDAALDADAHATRLLLTNYLISEHAAGTADLLLDMDPSVATRLLAESKDDLGRALKAMLQPPQPEATAPVDAATPMTGRPSGQPLSVPPAAPSTAPAEPEADPVLAQVMPALAGLLAELQPGHQGPAQAVLHMLLDVVARLDVPEVSELIAERLPTVGTVDHPVIAAALLTECRYRPLREWPQWTRSLSPAVTRQVQVDDPLASLLAQAWKSVSGEENAPDAADVRTAAAAIANLLDHREPAGRPTVTLPVHTSMGEPVQDDDTASRRLATVAAAEPLILAGVLTRDDVLAKETQDLPATLRLDLPEQGDGDPIVRYAIRTATNLLEMDELTAVGARPVAPEGRPDLVRALHDCGWLPEPHSTGLRLLARATEPFQDGLPPLPTTDEISTLSAEHGRSFDHYLAAWLALAAPDADALVRAVRPAVGHGPEPALLNALRRRTEEFSAADRLAVLASLLGDINEPAPGHETLSALGINLVPAGDVARLISDRYTTCGNDAQRRHVLDLWNASGISSDSARRALVQAVLTPMFELNPTNANVASRYLDALANPLPPGVKTTLGDAVKRNLSEDRAVRLLEPLGYKVKETRGWFTRRREVETGSSDDA